MVERHLDRAVVVDDAGHELAFGGRHIAVPCLLERLLRVFGRNATALVTVVIVRDAVVPQGGGVGGWHTCKSPMKTLRFVGKWILKTYRSEAESCYQKM
ncbi:MAG: hypothetical protein QG653_48 [Patescibacteria group bacterium]|nr:hypothetical protein [Patescibacteria group bacterium]